MRFLFIASLFLTSSFVCAQSSIEDTDIFPGPEWYTGTVVLTSGLELNGLMKYNDKNDILSFENGRDSRSFTARSVKSFKFYDEIERKTRSFCAIPVEDTKHNVKRPLFFEVVMELKDFAILSKLSPIKFEKREYTTPAMFNPGTGSFSAGRYYGFPSSISMTETLFVFSSDGIIRPYLQIVEKDIDGIFFDRAKSQNKILDEDAIRVNTGGAFKELSAFARKNDLSFKEKEDLILIMQYFQHMGIN
jgi:hypothetical protein